VTARADPYRDAVGEAHRLGLRIWLEADLVGPWLAGPATLRGAIRTVAGLAAEPGVVGVKFAEALGYADGLTVPDRIVRFLSEVGGALAGAAPGRLRLLDLAVPELSCLPADRARPHLATVAAARLRGRYPQLALDNVHDYLRRGAADVAQVAVVPRSAGTYAAWGVDADTVQWSAWSAAVGGWGEQVRLFARTDLSHPGRYPGDAGTAAAALRTGVDIPLRAGAAAVDAVTWRRAYRGWVARLADPGPRRNPLWDGLVARHDTGARLLTHLDPRSVERTVRADLTMIATACTDVYLAVGAD